MRSLNTLSKPDTSRRIRRRPVPENVSQLLVPVPPVWQLNKRGHSVTVFEREDRVGGLLMYGIPNMKLEKTVVQRRVDMMKAEGVEFRTGVDVGKDISAEQLKQEFDAVILACGSSNPRNINAEGRDADGIYYAVDFLKATTKSLISSNLSDGYYISAK